MEAEDVVKNSWKPKFTSEFSMGQFDFARLDKTLTQVDYLSAVITSTDVPSLEMIQQFLAQLKNLYDNFRPIMSNPIITRELDGIVKDAKMKKRKWEDSVRSGIPMNRKQILDFVDLLDGFKTRLYDLRQVIGLGIQVRRNMTIAEKIKKGVHGYKDFDNLPEA